MVGVIVMGFAIWLLKKGAESNRQEEIIEYVKSVKAWTDTYRNEFTKLSFAVQSATDPTITTNIPRVEGNKTAEWDVIVALKRGEYKEYHRPLNL